MRIASITFSHLEEPTCSILCKKGCRHVKHFQQKNVSGNAGLSFRIYASLSRGISAGPDHSVSGGSDCDNPAVAVIVKLSKSHYSMFLRGLKYD